MKHFDDVVQKTGFIKHELISIDVPEETDIKQIIQHSLKPIRDELKQINESMECLREEIMNTKSDIRKSERDIQILKKNIADSAQQHRFLSAELKQQLEAFQQKNQMTVEALQKQNLKAMDDLKKNFSSEFIKFCRNDIWGYFDMLKKYTEKVSADCIVPPSLRTERETVCANHSCLEQTISLLCRQKCRNGLRKSSALK